MCGIAGIVGDLPLDSAKRLELALERLVHRGPDSAGTYAADGAMLGIRRLAIIDRQGGDQPIYNEDRRVAVVCNGEIYNYREEASRLRGRGHRLQSESDINVIPHGYEDEGVDAVARWRGMFAAALWDAGRRRLVLWRDRVGKKPLFYRWDGKTLAFASELPALMALLGEKPAIVPDAVALYLRYGYIPQPWTVYDGVRCLPPASVLELEWGQEPLIRRYWSLERAPIRGPRPREEAVEAVESVIVEATKLRLRSDLPLGLFLSGGIDSGLVAAAAVQAGANDLLAFSVRVPDPQLDESAAAEATARQLGLPCERIELDLAPVEDVMRVATMYGQPFADSSAVASLAVARAAKRHRTVVLNGDGGDELFGGYRRYQAARWHQAGVIASSLGAGVLGKLGATSWSRRSTMGFATRALRWISALPEDRFATLTTDLFDDAAMNECFPALGGAAAKTGIEGFPPPYGTFREMLRADFEWLLPADLLVKMDIATMAVGLEARSPLLDQELAVLAWSLPDDLMLGRGETKPLLRALAQKRLPPAVATAPKRGFEVPVVRWLKTDLREMLADTVLGSGSMLREWAEPTKLRALLDDRLAVAGNRPQMIWAVLMLELFLREAKPATV